MRCLRCTGQMKEETFFDSFDDTGKFNFKGWRCLNCGEILDSLILANRKNRHLSMGSRKRKQILAVN